MAVRQEGFVEISSLNVSATLAATCFNIVRAYGAQGTIRDQQLSKLNANASASNYSKDIILTIPVPKIRAKKSQYTILLDVPSEYFPISFLFDDMKPSIIPVP